jgi:hypothetical protein
MATSAYEGKETRNNTKQFCFLVLGFSHGMLREFTDNSSETTVGPIFIGHEIKCANRAKTPKPKNIIHSTVKV